MNSKLNHLNNIVYIRPDLTVLEIKFNENLPGWLNHIIHMHNLKRQSFSKYASAIDKLITN